MASIPTGRGAVGQVAVTLGLIAIVAGTILPAAGCATPQPASIAPAPVPVPVQTDPDPGNSANLDAASPAAPAEVPATPTVSVPVDGTMSWAYLDRATGAQYASTNAADTSYTESMVKAWLAADALSRSETFGQAPDLDLIVPMIIDSDDDAAETVWLNNGDDASINRMIKTCQLTDTSVVSGWWSMTEMSARDAVRLGQCIADGTAAGPHWTDWLLDEMRHVRGEGRFGIVDGVDSSISSNLAIKNGWTLHYDDNKWRVNCLAIDTDWVLAVMVTYSGNRGLVYGANVCATVTKQIVAPL